MDGHEPDDVHAQVADAVQVADDAGKVVGLGVVLHAQLIDDLGVEVRIGLKRHGFHLPFLFLFVIGKDDLLDLRGKEVVARDRDAGEGLHLRDLLPAQGPAARSTPRYPMPKELRTMVASTDPSSMQAMSSVTMSVPTMGMSRSRYCAAWAAPTVALAEKAMIASRSGQR